MVVNKLSLSLLLCMNQHGHQRLKVKTAQVVWLDLPVSGDHFMYFHTL